MLDSHTKTLQVTHKSSRRGDYLTARTAFGKPIRRKPVQRVLQSVCRVLSGRSCVVLGVPAEVPG
eukprot:11506700-Alexandrium_andersonii.AAC.1